MRKTLFLSQMKETTALNYKYQCPYIFCDRGKWREDSWYFNSPGDIKEKAKKQGFLIN